MPCDTKLKINQTIKQRAEEVRRAVKVIDGLIASRAVTVRVGPQGAITFTIPDRIRDGITDACIYRRLMASGSGVAKAAIARAEALAGRSVDKKVLATGIHSHDGGRTWSSH